MVLLFARRSEAASPWSSPEAEKSSTKSTIGKVCRKLSLRTGKNEGPKRPLFAVTTETESPNCTPFQRVFRYFDTDGDGKISPSELRSCMNSVGEELSAEEAEAVVEANDSDGDRLLGMDDFMRLMANDSVGDRLLGMDDFMRLMEVEGEEERRKDLVEAFGMYEMEGLGCITPKSLKRMLSRHGEFRTIGECKTMIGRFDLDGDGVLSFEEFRVMMS